MSNSTEVCNEVNSIPELKCPAILGELKYPIASLPAFSVTLPSLNSVSDTYKFEPNEVNTLIPNPDVIPIVADADSGEATPDVDKAYTFILGNNVHCSSVPKKVDSDGSQYVTWLDAVLGAANSRVWIPTPVDFCNGEPLRMPSFWRKPIAGMITAPASASLVTDFIKDSLPGSTPGIIAGEATRGDLFKPKFKSSRDWTKFTDEDWLNLDEDDELWDEMNDELLELDDDKLKETKLKIIYRYRELEADPEGGDDKIGTFNCSATLYFEPRGSTKYRWAPKSGHYCGTPSGSIWAAMGRDGGGAQSCWVGARCKKSNGVCGSYKSWYDPFWASCDDFEPPCDENGGCYNEIRVFRVS